MSYIDIGCDVQSDQVLCQSNTRERFPDATDRLSRLFFFFFIGGRERLVDVSSVVVRVTTVVRQPSFVTHLLVKRVCVCVRQRYSGLDSVDHYKLSR